MQNVSFQNINSLWAFRNQNEFHNLTIFVQQLKVQRRFSQFSADCAPQKSLKREDNTNERKEEPGKSFRVSRICFKDENIFKRRNILKRGLNEDTT